MNVNLAPPTPREVFDAAQLSRAVYRANAGQGIPQGWDILCDSQRINEYIFAHPELFEGRGQVQERLFWEDHIVLDPQAHSHRSVAYLNRETNTIMIVNRGTVPTNLDNLIDDFVHIARHQAPPEWQRRADRFADLCIRYATQNNMRPILTGHSAGANLAQNTSVRTQVTAIGFDPAGGEEILRNSPQGYDPDRCRHIYTYLAPSNAINRAGTPIGNVTRLHFRGAVGDRIRNVDEAAIAVLRSDQHAWWEFMHDLEQPDAFVGHAMQLLDTHSINTIVNEAFDQTTGELHIPGINVELASTGRLPVPTPPMPFEQPVLQNPASNPPLANTPLTAITPTQNIGADAPFVNVTFLPANNAGNQQRTGISIQNLSNGGNPLGGNEQSSFTNHGKGTPNYQHRNNNNWDYNPEGSSDSTGDTPEHSSESRSGISVSSINGLTPYQRGQYQRFIRLFGLPEEVREHHLHKVRREQEHYHHALEDNGISKETQIEMVEESIQKWTAERKRQIRNSRRDEADKCDNQILAAQETLNELNSASPSYTPKQPKKPGRSKRLWEGAKEMTERVVNPTRANLKKRERDIVREAKERVKKLRKTEEPVDVTANNAPEQQVEATVNHAQNSRQETTPNRHEPEVIIVEKAPEQQTEAAVNHAQNSRQETTQTETAPHINESNLNVPTHTQPGSTNGPSAATQVPLQSLVIPQNSVLNLPVGAIIPPAVLGKEIGGLYKELSHIDPSQALQFRQDIEAVLNNNNHSGGSGSAKEASAIIAASAFGLGALGPLGWCMIGGAAAFMVVSSRPEETLEILGQIGSGLNTGRKLLFMTHHEKVEASALAALECLVNNLDILQNIRERVITFNKEWQREVQTEAARHLARLGENDLYRLATGLVLIPVNLRAQAWAEIAAGPQENDQQFWGQRMITGGHGEALTVREVRSWFVAYIRQVAERELKDRIGQVGSEAIFQSVVDGTIVRPQWYPQRAAAAADYFQRARGFLGSPSVNLRDIFISPMMEIEKRVKLPEVILSDHINLYAQGLLLVNDQNAFNEVRFLVLAGECWVAAAIVADDAILQYRQYTEPQLLLYSVRNRYNREFHIRGDVPLRQHVARQLFFYAGEFYNTGDYGSAKRLYKASLLSNWTQEAYDWYLRAVKNNTNSCGIM